MDKNTYLRFLPNSTIDETEDDFWLIFHENKLLVKNVGDKVLFPTTKELKSQSLNFTTVNVRHIGVFNERNCFIADVEESISLEDKFAFNDLRSLLSVLDEDMFLLGCRAVHLSNWYKNNQYCGRCGEKVNDNHLERSKVCPKCNLVTYPRISPAIIVAVVKDNKILLGQNKRFTQKIYSVLAGFVETGETFEECVMREVYEESGIRVKNIKYFGSQPWPFPDSLMVAFTAEYAGGDIKVDGEEIVHADWFEADKLPNVPLKGSIASELINWFQNNYRK